MTIAGPRGVQRVVESLRVIAPRLPYPVNYRELKGEPNEMIKVGLLKVTACSADHKDEPAEDVTLADLSITACPADHDTPCLAYRLSLDRAPAFQPERAKALGLPVNYWKLLQRGEVVEYEGRTYRPEQVLGPPRPGLSFGFLTDSRPTKRLVEFFTDVDLLITEATYGDPADQPKAIENKHMTFAEAATVGAASRARQLWFTHFTPALPNPDYFRREAEAIYPSVVIGREHMATTLAFAD